MTTDTCDHPTNDGTPCQLPAGDDGSCHIPAHGGSATDHGRPTRLDQDLIDDICDSVANGTLVKDVWAIHDVPRRTWEMWRRKGREDLEENQGVPSNIYGRFLWSLTRAEAKAREYYHRMLRDGVIRRNKPLRDDEGNIIRDDKGRVKMVPVRLDPETGEEIQGELVESSNLFKYLKARWSDEFAERTKLEHSGEVEGGVNVVISPELAGPDAKEGDE